MRIEVVTEIKASFVISDTGYTAKMTLPEIEKWVNDKLKNINILVKEGILDPRYIDADKKLIKVLFTPDEK